MYVIEPRIDGVHIHWQDGAGVHKLAVDYDHSKPVDIHNFPNLAAAGEIFLVIPTGLDVLTELKTILDAESLSKLSECASRLPEYNQSAFEIADQLQKECGAIPVHLIINSAFFQDLPETEKGITIDPGLFRHKYLRFGSDGLCHYGAMMAVESALSDSHRLISIHLGNQPSITAWMDKSPVFSSQGYSPLEGLISASGCGSIDPGIPLLVCVDGYPPASLRRDLILNGGWNSLIGEPIDIFGLVDQAEEGNTLPLDILLDQLVEGIGSACSILAGVDTIAFSVDSLQGSLPLISCITARLEWLGFKPRKSSAKLADFDILSGQDSKIKIIVADYSPINIINAFL